MAEYEKIVREELKKNGCYFVRHGKGDHDIWYSPITNTNVTVDGKIKIPLHRQRDHEAKRNQKAVLRTRGTILEHQKIRSFEKGAKLEEVPCQQRKMRIYFLLVSNQFSLQS